NHALGVVGETGDAVLRFARLRAGEDRDAVVRFLAAVDGLVSGGTQLGERKVRILDLRFLQAGDLWLRPREPVDEVRQAHLQGIDVPGREAQRRRSLVAPWLRRVR